MDFKLNDIIVVKDNYYRILEISSIVNGVQTLHVCNLNSNSEEDIAIDNNTAVELPEVRTKAMQFSYKDGNLYYFMDIDTYDQFSFSATLVEDYMKFIAEDSIVNMKFAGDRMMEVLLSDEVELKVIDVVENTNDGNIVKLDSGLEIKVPTTINIGDKVTIDTKRNVYIAK